jgi:hypothetical protein
MVSFTLIWLITYSGNSFSLPPGDDLTVILRNTEAAVTRMSESAGGQWCDVVVGAVVDFAHHDPMQRISSNNEHSKDWSSAWEKTSRVSWNKEGVG